jgi:hypothetical protein
MENLHLLLAIALVLYILSCNKKEGFAALTDAQKKFLKSFTKDEYYTRGEIFNNNKNLDIADAMMTLLIPLNTMINDTTTKDPLINQTKLELTNRGINIVQLRDNIVDCIIQILEAPVMNENPNGFISVIIGPAFSSKLNSIFLDLNKIDIAALSKSTGLSKDQFCRNLPSIFGVAYDKEDSSRKAQELMFMNQILSAYSNLIMMVYLFIMKNMDSISLYCGEDKTQQYKEFKKLFETVRTAMITKEDIDSKCPKPVPEKVCASYISEASTCNTDLASVKKHRTILIALVVILIIAVVVLAMK